MTISAQKLILARRRRSRGMSWRKVADEIGTDVPTIRKALHPDWDNRPSVRRKHVRTAERVGA